MAVPGEGGPERHTSEQFAPSAGDLERSHVLDRPRTIALSWAAACFAILGLLTTAVVTEWQPLVDLDDRSRSRAAWAVDAQWLLDVLRVIEVAFNTLAVTGYTVL